MTTAHIKKALFSVLCITVFGAFSCDTPERAAEVLTKKAKQQARKIALGNTVTLEECMDQLQGIEAEPRFSDHMAEKTELISTW